MSAIGEPDGAIVSMAPHVTESAAVNEFLRKHPRAVGLIAS